MQLALNKDTGQKVAINFLELDDELSGPAVMAELLTQRKCRQHPHVVQLQVWACQRPSVCVRPAHVDGNKTLCVTSTACRYMYFSAMLQLQLQHGLSDGATCRLSTLVCPQLTHVDCTCRRCSAQPVTWAL